MAEITNRERWTAVLHRQKRANAERWLEQLEANPFSGNLIISDYDNLLRALEDVLVEPDAFDLAFRFLRQLYPVVIGFADWARWLHYLEEALHISQLIGREHEEAQLLSMIANILVQQGEVVRAEDYLQTSATRLKQMGDWPAYGKLLGKLSQVAALQGNLPAAEALCQEALTIALRGGDHEAVGLANLDLSYIYLRSEKWAAGLETAQKAYACFQQFGQQRQGAAAMLNQVNCLAQLGEWEEAERVAGELMTLLERLADSQTMLRLQNNLGLIAFNQKDFARAESWWQEALRLNSQVQSPQEMAGLQNNLGMVYTQLGEWEAAGEMLRYSAEAYEQLGDVQRWANALDNLAELLTLRGETAVAQTLLQAAIARLERIEWTPSREELLNEMNGRLRSLKHSG